MTELFASLSQAMSAAGVVAVLTAFVWGVLSVVLSPCHLASIPLVVAFVDGQGRISVRRAMAISVLFSGGILITIAIIGVVTAVAGRLLGAVGTWANYFVAVVFFLIGLHLLGVFPIPFSGPGQVALQRKGLWAALVVGLVFGLALGPCTFAYMIPVLAVVFKVGAANVPYGALLLLAYGVGHCSVIVLAGTSAGLVQRYLNWTEESKASIAVKRICGLLIILGGLYLIYLA